MPAYQRLLWAQAIVLQSVFATQGRFVCPNGTLYSSAARPLLRCTWDGLFLDTDTLPDTVTLSGLWYPANGTDSSPLLPVKRRAVVQRVVQALAAAVRNLPTILNEWATLQPNL